MGYFGRTSFCIFRSLQYQNRFYQWSTSIKPAYITSSSSSNSLKTTCNINFRHLQSRTKSTMPEASTKPTEAHGPAAATGKEPTFEQQIKRNPHPDFKAVESSRPPFETKDFHYTKTVSPSWKVGSGANSTATSSDVPHREIDPYGEGRLPGDNYKLLISGIIPRPIGFISTLNTATSPPTANLAPFSYTNMVNHDPPIFCVGFSGGRGNPKDTCRNVLETGECVINIISEWFAEAANYTSVNAPSGASEWELSGLTPAPSRLVKPSRVKESAFSIEAKLVAHHEWTSPTTGKSTGVTCLFQGIHFWVREDVVNEQGNMIDPVKLKPVSRLGGVSYGRTTEGFELLRPDWEKEAEPALKRLHEESKKGGDSLLREELDGKVDAVMGL